MAASILPAVAALLVALCCPTAAHSPAPEPWPSCKKLYNYYWCRGHHEGGLICDGLFKRGSTEPLAAIWTREIQNDNGKHIPGQDDFGFLYNIINYEGQLKLSLRYCYKGKGKYSGIQDWFYKEPPPCKKNWYNCDLMDDKVSCQLRLCPWSKEPLLPLSGKATDWYGCTKVGDQVDCYLQTLGERKIHHKKHPDDHHEHLSHGEYSDMEHGYRDMNHDDL